MPEKFIAKNLQKNGLDKILSSASSMRVKSGGSSRDNSKVSPFSSLHLSLTGTEDINMIAKKQDDYRYYIDDSEGDDEDEPRTPVLRPEVTQKALKPAKLPKSKTKKSHSQDHSNDDTSDDENNRNDYNGDNDSIFYDNIENLENYEDSDDDQYEILKQYGVTHDPMSFASKSSWHKNRNKSQLSTPPEQGVIDKVNEEKDQSWDKRRHQQDLMKRSEENTTAVQAMMKNVTIAPKQNQDGQQQDIIVKKSKYGLPYTPIQRTLGDRIEKKFVLLRQELCSTVYEQNILGMKGPRKMTVLLPHLKYKIPPTRALWMPVTRHDTMIENYHEHKYHFNYASPEISGILKLSNKTPKWKPELNAYVLNFYGRVTVPSVKNFQIVSTRAPEKIILQFGKVSKNKYSMDFRYPLTPVQALSICVSSLIHKLACD